jgi:uncharacterized OB-fold protein
MTSSCKVCGAPQLTPAPRCHYCKSPFERESSLGGALISETDFARESYGRFKPSSYLAKNGVSIALHKEEAALVAHLTGSTYSPILNLLEDHDDVAVETHVRFENIGAVPTLAGLSVRGKGNESYRVTLWSTGSIAMNHEVTPVVALASINRSPVFRPNEFNRLKLVIAGDRLRMYLNENLLGSARNQKLVTGTITLWASGPAGAIARFSDVSAHEAT